MPRASTATALLLCVANAVAAMPTPAYWTLKDARSQATRLWIEAERMPGLDGWAPHPQSYCHAWPHVWSRGKLGADATNAPASATVQLGVPTTGRYNLWVHYDAVCSYDTAFGIRVEQAGEPRGDFGFGRSDQERWVPFGHGWTVHHPNWQWHHADVCWQFAAVDLEEGEALLTLYKGGEEHGKNRARAAARFVDAILLTDDLAERPDNVGGSSFGEQFLMPAAQTVGLFMRVRVPLSVDEPVAIRSRTHLPHLPPYYFWGSSVYTKTGRVEKRPHVRATERELLGPGEASAWCPVPIRPFGEGGVIVSGTTADTDIGGVEIELSFSPNGDPLARTFVVPRGRASFEFRTTRDPDRPEDLRSMDEIRQRLHAFADRLHPLGKRPQRFPVNTQFWVLDDPDLCRRLGETVWAQRELPSAQWLERNPLAGLWRSVGMPGREQWATPSETEAYRAKLIALREALAEAGLSDLPLYLKSADEPHALSLEQMARHDRYQAGFRDYCRSLELSPRELLAPGAAAEVARLERDEKRKLDAEELWEQVRLGAAKDSGNGLLYYHSQRYRAHTFANFYRNATELQRDVFGRQFAGNSVNFSPLWFAGGTGFQTGVDVMSFWREGGATTAWSESWHDNMPLLVSWTDNALIELFRGAIRGSEANIGFYNVTAIGRAISPASAQTKAAAIIAHGVRRLTHYCEHPIGNLQGPIFNLEPMLEAEATVNYALGEVEDLLLEADRVPTGIALLWPRTTFIFDAAHERLGGVNDTSPWRNCYEQEFVHLLAALNQAGYQADVLGEEDVAAGALADYRVLYMAADQLQSAAAEALAAWVRRGGVLYAVAGGGLRDERNQLVPERLDLYGLRGQKLLKIDRTVAHKTTLPSLRMIDTLTPSSEAASRGLQPLDAYCFYHALVPDDGKARILARSANRNAVLAVRNPLGKGQAVLIGTLPGVALMKPAFPEGIYARSLRADDLHTFQPTEFDDDARDWITLGARLARVEPTSPCDPPFVEALVWETASHFLVCIVNHSMEPAESVSVRLRGLGGIDSIRSQQLQREVLFERGDNEVQLALPVGCFDFLTLVRRR